MFGFRGVYIVKFRLLLLGRAMKLLKNIVLASVISCCCGNLYAGPASARLSALADSLIKEYQAKTAASNTTLAAFPFSCDEKLTKQRVGFAVAELMSHRFVAEPGFTVVERGEINRLLAEQKLQASGATDSATAVRLGRVLGAGALLLGNINKVDGVYQVNARIVNAETGEVLSSGYTELSADAFADDAGVYLNLVPEREAIGIYLLYNYRHNSNSLPVRSVTPNTYTITNYPKGFDLALPGGGIRYSPFNKFMVDLSLMGNGARSKAGHTTYTWGGSTYSDNYNVAVMAYRALLYYANPLSRRFGYYLGAGATLYSIHGGASVDYLTPTFSARFEFRPQSRIGVSLGLGYDLTSKSADSLLDAINEYTRTDRARLSKLYVEPSVSVYF